MKIMTPAQLAAKFGITEKEVMEKIHNGINLNKMKLMTPAELAAKLGLTEKEVMEKIHNGLKTKHNLNIEGNTLLPEQIQVRRIRSDKYIIWVPADYKFQRSKIT